MSCEIKISNYDSKILNQINNTNSITAPLILNRNLNYFFLIEMT